MGMSGVRLGGGHLRNTVVLGGATLLALGYSLLIVSWPLPAMMAPVGLTVLALFTRSPQWMLLAFFTSLAIPIQRTVFGLPLNSADGLLVVWCALWPFMMMRADAPAFERWRPPSIVLFISPFIIVTLLSQIGSINFSGSLKQVVRILEWFVVLPLLLTAIAPDRKLRDFAGVMLMVIPCAFSIDGIYEYFNNGQTLTGLIGIAVPTPEGNNSQIRHTFDVSGRAGSSFGGAQGLAMYLVMTMGFSIAHLLYADQRWMKQLAFVCLAISVGGLAVAQSRGGFMGAAAVVAAIALVTVPKLRLPVALMSGLMLAASFATLGLLPGWDGSVADLVPGRPEAVLDRLIIWGVVRDVFFEHPFLGVGLGNFRDAFFAQEPWLHVDLAYPSLHAHNTFLELLADTGGLGLGTYLLFLCLCARRLLNIMETCDRPLFTLAALGSLAAYSIFAMVDMLLLQNMHFLLILVLSLGMNEAASPAIGVRADKAKESLK
jgi:O-Antigen ligase